MQLNYDFYALGLFYKWYYPGFFWLPDKFHFTDVVLAIL